MSAGRPRDRTRATYGWYFSVAAWVLVCQFVAGPAISRALDHLSQNDQSSGFKFSKNIERPLNKHVCASVAVLAIVADVPKPPVVDGPVLATPHPLLALLSGPASLRAPPAA